MKKTLIIILSLAMAAMFMFAGCASKSDEDYATGSSDGGYYAGEPAYDTAESYPQEAPEADMDGEYVKGDEGVTSDLGLNANTSILEPGVNRKIIYTGYISARTKNFDEDYQNILSKVEEAGGYIESAYVNGTEPEEWRQEGRYAEITLRVPSDKFDSFIAMLKGVGQTMNSSVTGSDITIQYADIEARLKNLRIRQERLQELLNQAASLEDIIELERELANVSYEIESYESMKRDYDSLIDFSKITVTLQEVAEQAEIVPPQESLGDSIKNGFFNVLNGLAVFGRWLLVAFIASSPVLFILAAILVIVLVSVKAAKKRRAKKQQGQQ